MKKIKKLDMIMKHKDIVSELKKKSNIQMPLSKLIKDISEELDLL